MSQPNPLRGPLAAPSTPSAVEATAAAPLPLDAEPGGGGVSYPSREADAARIADLLEIIREKDRELTLYRLVSPWPTVKLVLSKLATRGMLVEGRN